MDRGAQSNSGSVRGSASAEYLTSPAASSTMSLSSSAIWPPKGATSIFSQSAEP